MQSCRPSFVPHQHRNGGDVAFTRFLSGSPHAFTPLEDDSMTHRVRNAFGRCSASFVAVGIAALVALAPLPLAAQQTTGKVEGTVSDQAGVPIANAQVSIAGASLCAVPTDKGYEFI